MSAPAVVLFDLDGTLFDHPTAFARGILAHLRSLGEPYTVDDPAETVAAWQLAEDRHYERYLAGELDYDGQRIARAREFTARFGVTGLDDDALLDWFAGYHRDYREAWSAYDDALPALDALEEALPGVRFGIITNGELALQLRKVRLIGAADRMAEVIASGDVGAAKPDPAIFAHAVERFGVPPADAVYVGDKLRVDALGAADAGLRAVWIDRGEVGWGAYAGEAAERGIRRIVSLSELPALLTPGSPRPR
ncbi:HAD family hydrolase [Gryllotalpicola ginsengisoli]|uniref:HAD family hydrolase n=1 Tax=Gryllotalpicola ginsengisoli TaxID=444608 RepID=UPI0003B3AEE9|nr:HAD family hydrolase [Gryllotalpicola ginsengisoli]